MGTGRCSQGVCQPPPNISNMAHRPAVIASTVICPTSLVVVAHLIFANTLFKCSWLEAGGPEVQRVLRAERQHAHAWLQRCAQRADKLRAAMLQEVPEAQVGGKLVAWELHLGTGSLTNCLVFCAGNRDQGKLSTCAAMLGAILLLGVLESVPPLPCSSWYHLCRCPSLSGWGPTNTMLNSCPAPRSRAICGGLCRQAWLLAAVPARGLLRWCSTWVSWRLSMESMCKSGRCVRPTGQRGEQRWQAALACVCHAPAKPRSVHASSLDSLNACCSLPPVCSG